LSAYLALPFLSALTWALVLAIVLMPFHRLMERHVRSPATAALLTATGSALLICLPIALVVQQLAREAARGAVYVEEFLRRWDAGEIAPAYPGIARVISWLIDNLDPAGSFAALSEWLTGNSASFVLGSIGQAITLALTFYLLFYFLRDREQILAAAEDMSPLEPDENLQIRNRFAETVHATLVGTVLVAAVQGTLGGLMFWWLGLPTPVFWGLVMGLLAIVPVLGAFVVWIPAAIYLAFEGRWLDALLLTCWGGVIVAGIDNLLYPVLVGNKLRLHTVLTFIGAVGGIVLFGAAGLVLGPAIIAVTLTLVGIARKRLAPAETRQ
jgi:predicted PurR-regulated permease PerM